jgi:hypothetical protein
VFNQSGNVFVQFFLVFFWNKTSAALHSKNKLQVDLGKGVSHGLLLKKTESKTLYIWQAGTFLKKSVIFLLYE